MQIHKYILKTADAVLNFVIIFMLCLAGLYSVYALWDNGQVYAAAENVQEDMRKLKIETAEGEEQVDFGELMKINPDVCAWITLDGTHIDYPILQGENNLTYINTDVYGNFALAGSIFLDTRCDRGFGDKYSLVYGHFMDENKMFGDLELYKEKAFFENNRTGTLILPGETCRLEIFACLVTGASEDSIFDPDIWGEDIQGLLEYVEQNALYVHEDTWKEIQDVSDIRMAALTTCSSEFTDARTVVLAIIHL